MNVKFISVAAGGFKTYDPLKYKGYFVHLTEAATVGAIKYPAGLYFGGESDWEYLTNDTNVAAIEQKKSKTLLMLLMQTLQFLLGMQIKDN